MAIIRTLFGQFHFLQDPNIPNKVETVGSAVSSLFQICRTPVASMSQAIILILWQAHYLSSSPSSVLANKLEKGNPVFYLSPLFIQNYYNPFIKFTSLRFSAFFNFSFSFFRSSFSFFIFAISIFKISFCRRIA